MSFNLKIKECENTMTRPIMTNKIGVIVDSFGVGVKQGLLKAKQLGADGVQIYAVGRVRSCEPISSCAQGMEGLHLFLRSRNLSFGRRSWWSWLSGSCSK